MPSEAYDDQTRQAIAAVAGADARHRILRALADSASATPSELIEQTDVANVSRPLTALRDVGCVELVVPEGTRKGRVHAITDRGETVLGGVGDG